MAVTPYSEIPVNRSAVYGSALVGAVAQLQAAINQIAALDAKANTMVVNNGDGTNSYAQVETQFGLIPTGSDTASTGYALKYQLNAVSGLLNNATILQFLAQVG